MLLMLSLAMPPSTAGASGAHHEAASTSLVPDGRGRRTPQTLLLIDERDKLLIEAAHFFPGTKNAPRSLGGSGQKSGAIPFAQ